MAAVQPPPLPLGAGSGLVLGPRSPGYGAGTGQGHGRGYGQGYGQGYSDRSDRLSKPPSVRSSGGLRHTGALISGGSGIPQEQPLRPPSSNRSSARSLASSIEYNQVEHGPPNPPSARTGLMFSRSAPSLTPRGGQAEMVASMKNVHLRRRNAKPEGVPKAVWSDSNAHLDADAWPHHAIPLWVFHGKDRPRPGFKEEVRFTLREEKYINFCVRLHCGVGDHYNGGAVGLVYSPDRSEAVPGTEGQLITIIDVNVQPNNTVAITAVGDVHFKVKDSWMPRGMMGLQMAHIEASGQTEKLDNVLETCATEPNMTLFAKLMAAVPHIAEQLQSGGPFTVFVPTNDALANLGLSEQEMLESPHLEYIVGCHICPGRVACEAMYSGRTLQALDGTILQVTFTRWPRGAPSVNEVPIEHMDINCTNGVIHSIVGMMNPAPAPSRRRR
eukprot:TRINITY_DN63745_c0_g1_i1.p2 TRINITY_DN63745_c0_g1~~TRINITY_DN63745_c0_g1_i1.p2  ORF type:complete len:442 (+),score=63.95 TRINITY_DN63745_c0_g1_i1:146-1471(+)